MFNKIKSKKLGKSHEVRVETSEHTDCSFIYVMVINHDCCALDKEYFDTVEDAIEFFNKFKTVTDCKLYINRGILPL